MLPALDLGSPLALLVVALANSLAAGVFEKEGSSLPGRWASRAGAVRAPTSERPDGNSDLAAWLPGPRLAECIRYFKTHFLHLSVSQIGRHVQPVMS